MQFLRPSRLTQSTRGASLPISIADLAVYTFVFLIGAFQSTHYLRTPDNMVDATYLDLAQSLLEQGTYQVSLLPQTTLPPGFPFILALAGRFVGLAPAIVFGVIAACTTLGLIAAYELLRRVEGRGVAAAACLLLGSYPPLFGFNTGGIFPEMSYLLASMLALLLALRIDRAEPSKALIGWEVLLGVTLAMSVLIRSVGIALLVGLIAWIAASLLMVPETGRRRMKRFLIPLVLGIAAQLGWSVWAQRHQTLEWQLPGYPQSYLSQLKVKNGHYPELGMAHLSDIPARVGRNIIARTAGFDQLLIRRYISKFWSSPAIIGVVLLIAVGLASSLRNGGQLHDWYFLWYEAIYLVWPWDYRDRFLYPVVPLASLYLWRGAVELKNCSIRQPKAAGLCLAVFGSFLSLISAGFAFRIIPFAVEGRHERMDHLQPIAATVFWVILTAIGFGIYTLSSLRNSRDGGLAFARISQIVESKASLPLRSVTILAIAVLVGTGTAHLVANGRRNLNPDIAKQGLYPELEAAEWVRTHEPSSRVVMAREPEFIYHYTHRRVVWFPPISDPQVLMDGIRRHHVEVVVVTHHEDSYWLPPEDECFQSLLKAYPSVFHLSHRGPDNWVFEVAPSPAGT